MCNYRVLLALNEDGPTREEGKCVKTYFSTCVIDVNTFHTLEEGAHSPSWPNGLTIIILINM